MNLVALPPDKIEEAREVILPFAEQMHRRFPDDWPIEETVRQGIEKEIVLWVVWEPSEKKAYGLVGTKLVEKPSGKRVFIVVMAAGHDHDRWVHLIDVLIAEARKQHCKAIQTEGRDWSHQLAERGFQRRRECLLTKEL